MGDYIGVGSSSLSSFGADGDGSITFIPLTPADIPPTVLIGKHGPRLLIKTRSGPR
jgi:hypothetical protein